jgi:DNA repair protein RadC
MRLKEMCADEMPREKLINKGPEALSNVELLAILLRTGRGGANVIDVSRELLLGAEEKLVNLAMMNMRNLCRISGVGPGKAVTLAAAFELGRRVSMELVTGTMMALSTPQAVYRLMLPVMRDLDHEECWALYLNKSNKLLSKERLTIGGMDSTVIDNRMVLRKALDNKAAGLILVHNHPSGSALPSNADLEQTRSLNKALKTCGISLVDHVIIAGNSYYSFADEQF